MQIIFTARGETNIDFWFQYFRYFFHDPVTLPGPTQNNFISLQAFLAKKTRKPEKASNGNLEKHYSDKTAS